LVFVGPDLVIAGAARSGTSTLAAHLALHPNIDAGAIKEPNYFSREFARGDPWFDTLFAPRTESMLRMDASTSYTYPQFPEALKRLVDASPDVFVVYSVRDPVPRAVSHYVYRHFFLRLDTSPTFGAALAADTYYTDVSDYAHWLSQLRAQISDDRLLVVPFDALTRSSHDVTSVICQQLGIPAPTLSSEHVDAHQNSVVQWRSERLRPIWRRIRRSPNMRWIQATIGRQRIRRVRSALVRDVPVPSREESLASCSDKQMDQLHALEASARSAVEDYLEAQDRRLDLQWARDWTFD
jgi:hypothetical protein